MPSIGRRTLLVALPGTALVNTAAQAQALRLSLGTASEGGGFTLYGSAFIDAIKLVDPLLAIRETVTRGSAENVPLLEAGKLDLGLVLGDVAYEIFAGIGRPPTRLKVVSVMYSAPGMFAVRADSRYRRIDDLKGRPVVWNSRGSGLAVQGRYVMDGLDLDPDKDFEAVYIDRLSAGPAMVIDGRASALWGAGYRWPGFVTIASEPRGGRFVVPDADETDRILAKYSFMRRLTVPAGLYPGQTDPIQTIGSWSFVLARADLDDAIGYQLAAALHKGGRASLSSMQLSESTAANTLAALPKPDALQGGVLQFYKEAGLTK